jgi:hypothetical protein
VIECVQTAYPDCEAKHRVKGERGYERVPIEFEFRSSNFNPSARGLRPHRVLGAQLVGVAHRGVELRSAIRSLSGEPR